MKNYLRIIALVVVAVLLFGLGFGLGQRSGITVTLDEKAVAALGGNGGGSATVSTSNPPATEPPATNPPATEPPADTPDTPSDTPDTPDTPSDTPDAPSDTGSVPSTTAEIVKAYNDVIAKAKATQNMTVHKVSDVQIGVTDCSIPAATSLINPIVQRFVTGSDETWTFAGSGTGTNANGETMDADKLIPPGRRAATLAESYVASASATPAGDGYTMTITLNSEKSTFDGTNTVEPAGQNSVVDALNLATMDISPASISAADMTYSATVLTATVDGQGRLTKLTVKLPLSGTGEGGISFFKGISLTLEGELNDTYDFTY